MMMPNASTPKIKPLRPGLAMKAVMIWRCRMSAQKPARIRKRQHAHKEDKRRRQLAGTVIPRVDQRAHVDHLLRKRGRRKALPRWSLRRSFDHDL